MSALKAVPIQQGPYRFHELPASLYPFEVHLNIFRVVHFLSWALWLLHFIIDIALAYRIEQDTPQVAWRIWIALLCNLLLSLPEIFTACTIALALCTKKVAHPRPDYQLQGRVAPTVDIMITSCGESADIVINTVAAAAVQDYPSEQFRVFVLDDGHDAELRHAIDLLKLRLNNAAASSIIYLTRNVAPDQESYFKSGNLRFGIEESQRLGQGSEFFAGLDADMIPERDWLKRMVPHLIQNEKVAIAASPQVRRANLKFLPLPRHFLHCITMRYTFLRVKLHLAALLQRPRLRSVRPTNRLRHLLQRAGAAQRLPWRPNVYWHRICREAQCR